MFAPKKEEFVDPVTGETKKRQVKYYQDAYKNRIGRSYTEYEQYRQLNLFEDFRAYNKEGKDRSIDLIGENQIENSMEGTETPQGATVPVHDTENPIQNSKYIASNLYMRRKRQTMRQSLKSTPPIIGDVASCIRPEDYLTMA